MGGHTGTLYIGVTSDLYIRILEHKSAACEGFSARYKCTRLLYYETFDDIRVAINREKQLKGSRREKNWV
jgi:putative endonuclease